MNTSSSFLPWVLAAVAVFWAVGAYNRLVRLRAQANAAFAELEVQLQRQLQLVHASIPPEEAQAASQFEGGSAFWAGLQGAAAQMAASLAAAAVRPLDPERMAALAAAQDVLAMAWERAEREDTHDLAGPRLPPDIGGERAQMLQRAEIATARFDEAVAAYNEAIAQFPAVLLAWLFGFRPARQLRTRP